MDWSPSTSARSGSGGYRPRETEPPPAAPGAFWLTKQVIGGGTLSVVRYSTVTDLARFLG
jgi:hypothetical protein